MALSHNTIRSIRLVNLQSWDDSDNKLDLSDRGINVLRARSETGKSVFRKVFTVACFPTLYGPRSRKALIRRGCEEGTLKMELSNGTRIEIIIREKKILYKMMKSEDNAWRTWETTSMPEEIREELGWYVDDDNKIILNVIDSDHGKVFIDTSPKFNAAVLKHLTDEPRVTQARQTVSEWMDLLGDTMKKIEPILISLKRECETGKFIDPAAIEEKLVKCKSIECGWASVEETLAHLQSVTTIVQEKPEGVLRDISTAEDCYNGINALTKFLNCIEQMEKFVTTKPVFNGYDVDFEYGDSVLTAQKAVRVLEAAFIDFCKSMASKPVQPKDHTVAKPYYVALDSVTEVSNAYKEYLVAFQRYMLAKADVSKSKARLKEVEEALGVCPLCGARLCDHGTN